MNDKFVSGSMGALRMLTGLLMTYHGLEVFSPEKMEMYKGWEVVKQLPVGNVLVYLGKYGELAGGILLTLGLFARWAALVLAAIMFFICFFIGNGRFWYEDQHPFLFAMMTLVFAIYGPGAWALDHLKTKK
jgi:putative oxidoreductase